MTAAAPQAQRAESPDTPPSSWIRRQAERLAEVLIEQLRQGTAPWQKPWKPGERPLPYSLSSGREYSGFNAITLAAMAEMAGYEISRWGTYRQIAQAGGQVRKGEKGVGIIVLKRYGRKLDTDEAGKPVLSPEGKKTYRVIRLKHPFIRGYTVFNTEQADGIAPPERTAQTPEWDPVEEVDRLLRESGVKIVHNKGDRAYYSPAADRITLPRREQFASTVGFYQTTLHELGHATGHPSRLNRKLTGRRDTPEYAREELRAEMCAMLTGTRIGVGHEPSRGAAYVDSWIQQLQRHPMEIHAAAIEAGQMSEYILEMGRDRVRPVPRPRRDKGDDLGI